MNVEQTIQFILEHQAQHAVEIQELREQVKALTGSIMTIVQVQNGQQGMIGSLIAAMNELADNQKALQEGQRTTRENLNALIKIVDELIRRDGRPPQA